MCTCKCMCVCICICICFYMCICLCSFDCLCAAFASISAGTSSVIRGAIVAVFVSSFHCFFSSSLSLFLSISCSFVLSLGQPPLLVSRAFYALLLTLAKLWPQPLEGIIIVLGFRDPLLINNSTAALRVIIHLSSLLFCRVQVEGLMIIVLLWGSLIWTI